MGRTPRRPCLGFLGNCLQKSAANEFLWWTMTWRAPAAWRRCNTCKCNQCNNQMPIKVANVGRGMLLDLLWPVCVWIRKLKPSKLHVDHVVKPKDERDKDHQFDPRWNSAIKNGQIQVGETFPEIYLKGGIMERGNFSACAGFSSYSGRCAVFGTFAAFQEMILSEASNRARKCSDLYIWCPTLSPKPLDPTRSTRQIASHSLY